MMIGYFIFLALFFCGIFFLLTKMGKEHEKEVDKVKKYIGSKVVIDKDTLTILDYSMLNSNYTLSNGKEVSFELAEKLSVK